MYLHEFLVNESGTEYKMVGEIPGKAFSTNKLQRFGYVRILANENNILCDKNTEIRAHEFHYWDSTNCGNSFKATKESNGRRWNCVHASATMYAGFPHLYFYSNISTAEKFICSCAKFGGRNDI